MSLIAWYPLNGDLKNKGVGDMNLTTTTSPTYVDSKFGKGISTGGVKWTATQTASILNNKALSIAFWIKVTGTNYGVLFGTGNTSGANNRKFTIFQYPNANSLHLSWQNDASDNIFFGCIENNFFTTNEWVHCCITYDNPNICIYRNGTLYKKYTGTSNSASFAYETNVINSKAGRIINDMRFYDHCLSPKEVKEISKGLILHYPLNQIDGYIGGRNLIKVQYNYGMYDYTKKATKQVISDNSTSTGKALEITVPSDSETYSNYRIFVSFSRSESAVLKDGKTYTISFKAKASKDLKDYSFYYEYLAKTIKSDVTTEWKQYTATGTAISSYSALYVCFSEADRQKLNGCKLYIADVKLELGGVATPYTISPEINSSAYDNIVYDISGYGNNGTISGTLTSDNNTPIGMCSTKFDGKSYINAGRGAMVTDEITVSLWYKYDGSTFVNPISCTEGGGWNLESSNNNVQFSLYKLNIGYNNSMCSKTNLITGWNLITATYNGHAAKIYINGILKHTGANTETKTPIKYHASNAIFISAEAGDNANTPVSIYSNQIADVRIYATALSADDIKELYQTKFIITDNGKFFANEYVESNTTKFNKTGVANSVNLFECQQLADANMKILDDGSTWIRIFHHNNKSGSKLFSSSDKFATEAVIYDEDRYSRLYLLNNFKSPYEFMAEQSNDEVWRWTQTNNPIINTNAGTVKFISGSTSFSNGIMRCSGNTFLAQSNRTNNWWCAIGCWTNFNGGGIPGFGGKTVQGTLDLWLRIDNQELTQDDKTFIYKDAIITNELIEN